MRPVSLESSTYDEIRTNFKDRCAAEATMSKLEGFLADEKSPFPHSQRRLFVEEFLKLACRVCDLTWKDGIYHLMNELYRREFGTDLPSGVSPDASIHLAEIRDLSAYQNRQN